jgi:hypothetical protein
MVCHLAELLKVKFTKELSVVNQPNLVKVGKLTDAALLPIELVTLCFTPFSVVRSVMTAFSSLNTSLWT